MGGDGHGGRTWGLVLSGGAACGLANSDHYSDVIDAVLGWMLIEDAPEPPADIPLPNAVVLHGNYPNPFNPNTTIRFDLASPMQTKLSVFDVLGREVAELIDAPLAGGGHSIYFDGRDLASGVYIVHLEAGEHTLSKKMMLLK